MSAASIDVHADAPNYRPPSTTKVLHSGSQVDLMVGKIGFC